VHLPVNRFIQIERTWDGIFAPLHWIAGCSPVASGANPTDIATQAPNVGLILKLQQPCPFQTSPPILGKNQDSFLENGVVDLEQNCSESIDPRGRAMLHT
jgi:hypothetical protein